MASSRARHGRSCARSPSPRGARADERERRGALSDRDHRAFSGVGAASALLPHADVVLAVGTRYVMPPSGLSLPRPARPSSSSTSIPSRWDGTAGRITPSSVTRSADSPTSYRGFRGTTARVPSRAGELRALKAGLVEEMGRLSIQAEYALAIRDVLPDDGVLVSESTQVGYWSQGGGFPVYEPRSFLTSGYQGTLGYGFATALGAQVGNPHRKVVSINGDGGFFYNVQELSTMARHGIPLVAIVFNDNAYGNVRRIQQVRFNDHTIGSDLLNPDLVKLGELFGVASSRATNPRELRATLEQALASNAPHLIEVPMPPTLDVPQQFPMEPLPPRPVLA
ncbi:MAG: thiamine pyrophosphate-dependent enzyme [Dehalococcoidia bacterium]